MARKNLQSADMMSSMGHVRSSTRSNPSSQLSPSLSSSHNRFARVCRVCICQWSLTKLRVNNKSCDCKFLSQIYIILCSQECFVSCIALFALCLTARFLYAFIPKSLRCDLVEQHMRSINSNRDFAMLLDELCE